MDLIKYIIKYVNYPLVMTLLGNVDRLTSYSKCKKEQYKSYQINEREQQKRLYDIVKYATQYVPYYRDIVIKENLSFSEDSIMEDVKKLPILTKDIIRKEGDRLYSTEMIKFSVTTSGGSTGEPVTLRRDKYLTQIDSGKYFLSYAGYDIGDKILLIWGSERDILQNSIGVRAKISNYFVHRRRLLNSFMMTKEDMRKYVHFINSWKPKVILAYTQSMYELSKFIKEENMTVYSPEGIVVSAGTLFDDWKKEIKDVFKCPVINQYGSRETPGIAISCKEDKGLHINTYMNYVEVVGDNNVNLPNDIDGNIIVTNLINKSMPLIRYKIGDIGSLSSNHECECGRNLPCLNHVKGRVVNIFKKRDGTKIDGEYFTHLFYGILPIIKFQVIQRDYEEIDVIMEVTEKLKEEIANDIISKIKIVMGEVCEVNLKYVDELLPTKSGKYLYTISLI